MDDIDRSILNVLQDNARLSYRKIAEKIGTTAATVSSRVQEMETKGIIKKYTVLLDYDKLSKVTLLLTVNADVSKIYRVTEEIQKFVEVCCILRVTGSFDLVALVRCDGHQGACELLDNISSIDGVRNVTSQVVLETIQESLCVRV